MAANSAGYAPSQLSEYAAMAKGNGADTAQDDEIRRERNERHRRERAMEDRRRRTGHGKTRPWH